MNRKDELLKVFESVEAFPIVSNTIDEVVYMENKLQEYKNELDKIALSAGTKNKYAFYNKLYLDTMAKYNTAVQSLIRIANKQEIDEESPLREFFKMVNEK